MITGIPSDQINQWWPLVEPFVARGLEYADGKYSTEDIRRGLNERTYQLWMANVLDSICVTTIVDYPRKRVCNVLLAAGNHLHRWVDEMDATISAWAKENGCRSIETYGRPGWERVLKNNRKLHVVLGREL